MLVGLGLMVWICKRQCAWSLAGRRPVRNFSLRAEHCWGQIDALGQELRNHPDIERIQFITQDQAFNLLEDMLSDELRNS